MTEKECFRERDSMSERELHIESLLIDTKIERESIWMYVCERGREVCVGGERERVCESKCLSKNVRERYCFSKREREKTRGSIS